MNRWLQSRIFTCLKCGVSYLHDHAYRHQFQCPMRNKPVDVERGTSKEAPCRISR